MEKKFFEKTLEDYKDQVWGCARCNWCQNHWGWNVKSAEYSEICPAFGEYRFFAYSGMGKMHIARALLEGDFDYEMPPNWQRLLIDVLPAVPVKLTARDCRTRNLLR